MVSFGLSDLNLVQATNDPWKKYKGRAQIGLGQVGKKWTRQIWGIW